MYDKIIEAGIIILLIYTPSGLRGSFRRFDHADGNRRRPAAGSVVRQTFFSPPSFFL